MPGDRGSRTSGPCKADPTDSQKPTPRPEWYFLFLFQFVKLFNGPLEIVGAVIIPTIAMLVLLLMPFIDRGKMVRLRERTGAIAVIVLAVIGWKRAHRGRRCDTEHGNRLTRVSQKSSHGSNGSPTVQKLPPSEHFEKITAEAATWWKSGRGSGLNAGCVATTDRLADAALQTAGYPT